MRGHSVLLVPVPELETFVRERTVHYDADYVSADPRFVHAHITALGPFAPRGALDGAALAGVAGIASATAPFDFTLATVDTFPNGIVHLVPEPAVPFRELTALLWRAFPDFPPYAGQFADIVPHLTLDALSPWVTEESTRRLVARHMPAHCRAERLDLVWYEPGNCHVLGSWPLGGASPDETLCPPTRQAQRPAAVIPSAFDTTSASSS